MQIAELHYAFKLAKDRIDTLANQDFNVVEIDWLLNEAQIVFTKNRFSEWNNKRRGFESNAKRIADLSALVVKNPLQPPITPTLDSGVYEVKLSDLLYPYLFFVSGTVDIVDANSCTTNVPLKFIQHDDYLYSFRDPFNSPSLEFIPYNFGLSSTGSGTSIYIYPGDYTISSVYVEYIKYPSRVSYGNYTYIDGVNYPQNTFELSEHTHQEIVDLACQIAALNIENPEYIQLKNQKIMIQE